MKLTIDHVRDIAVVRVAESRLMYPLLSDFSTAVVGLIGGGRSKVIVDLAPVVYIDSATIGCLMDLYRQAVGGRRVAEARGRAEAGRNDVDDDRGAQLHPVVRRRGDRAGQLRGVAMRTIKTTTGAEIPLDGDLLTVMETLYHEVTARRELERSFEDMVREIAHLIGQMTEEERRAYLQESLFLNTVTYENERLGAYMRKLAGQD